MDETNGHAHETEGSGSLDERTKLEKLTARLYAYLYRRRTTHESYRSIVAQKMEELPRGFSDRKGKASGIIGKIAEREKCAAPTTNRPGIQEA